MTPAPFPAMNAVTELRRAAAAVVALCDTIIFASEGEGAAALRALPRRIRTLQRLSQRTLTALESEGIS
jgi:hypothetical protein